MWKLSDGLRGRERPPLQSWPGSRPEDFEPEFLAAVVGSAAEGIVVLDGDYRIVYANPFACERIGYPLDRLLGQDRLGLLPEHERQTYQAFLDRARAGNSELSPVIISRPDGSELEFEMKASILDLRGQQFFVVVGRDATERRGRSRQASGLAQAALDVAANDSIDAILDAICKYALAGTRARAAWVTLDDEDQVAAWVGTAGVPDGFRERLRPAASATATRPAAMQHMATHGVLVHADARQLAEQDLEMAGVVDALKSLPWQAAAWAPLRQRGAVVGVLTAIYRKGVLPNEAETSFLATLADQAAMAVATARLLAAAREKVTLEERQRLARELHDSVSQSLYAIELGATTARERLEQDSTQVAQIDYIRRLAEASQAEMRALIFELRPEALETEGLVAALDRQIDVLRARHGLAATAIAGAEPKLLLEVKQALYRIAQEALWNTVKHARARHVDVRLGADGDSVLLEVADDGVGFDPDGSFPGHLGLRSMRERAAGAGGTLEVVSTRGGGTRVVVRVPSTAPSPPRRARASRSLPRRTRRAA